MKLNLNLELEVEVVVKTEEGKSEKVKREIPLYVLLSEYLKNLRTFTEVKITRSLREKLQKLIKGVEGVESVDNVEFNLIYRIMLERSTEEKELFMEMVNELNPEFSFEAYEQQFLGQNKEKQV